MLEAIQIRIMITATSFFILSTAPPSYLILSYLILSYLTSFLSSLLRLQKNLWVISTSRKSAPIEPTLVLSLHDGDDDDDYLQHDVNDKGDNDDCFADSHPAPKAKHTSQYCHQLLNWPDNLRIKLVSD